MNNDQNQESASAHSDPVYFYKDAGIQEQHGHVPPWLWAVAVSLVIWGIYYMIANWSPPAT